MQHIIIKEEIIDKGWLAIDFPAERPLVELAESLGNILPQPNGKLATELLQKASTKQGNSLSSRFGYGEFPLHTDGVGMPVPPSLVLLRARREDCSMQPTRIATIAWPQESTKKYALLADNQMTVNIGTARFYSPVINRKTNNRLEFIRYNPCCMIAPSDAAGFEETLDSLVKKANIQEIHWKIGTVIALYNWRVLHGRGSAANAEAIGQRMLERCWIR